MSKNVKKIIGKAAPIAAAFIPGMQPLAAAAIGAGAGALSGGGLKGALLGGATGGLGNALGAGGVLSDTMVGRAVSGLQDSLSDTILGRGLSTVGKSLGSNMIPGTPGINPNAGAGTFGNLTDYIKPVSQALGGYQQYQTQKKNEDLLLDAQRKAEVAMRPYSEMGLAAQQQLSGNLAKGFDPNEVYNDPGYKVRLSEGENALQRALAASGMGASGAALKAAQQYGQDFASNEVGNAYERWLGQNQQLAGVGGSGYNAASNLGGIYDTMGDIRANANTAKTNTINKTLQAILSGRGALDEEEEQL